MPAVQIPSKLLSSKRWVGGQRLQNLRLKLGYLVRCEANEAVRANPHYCFRPPGLHPLRIKWCWSSASRPAPAPRRLWCHSREIRCRVDFPRREEGGGKAIHSAQRPSSVQASRRKLGQGQNLHKSTTASLPVPIRHPLRKLKCE